MKTDFINTTKSSTFIRIFLFLPKTNQKIVLFSFFTVFVFFLENNFICCCCCHCYCCCFSCCWNLFNVLNTVYIHSIAAGMHESLDDMYVIYMYILVVRTFVFWAFCYEVNWGKRPCTVNEISLWTRVQKKRAQFVVHRQNHCINIFHMYLLYIYLRI